MRFTAPIRLTIVILLSCGALACGDSDPSTAPRAENVNARFAHLGSHGGTVVASCKAQAEARQSAWIGPQGGTLTIGTSRLVIPSGALATDVEITAHAIPSDSAKLEFSPSGLQFAKPAVLTMSYASCETPLFGVTVAYLQADTVTEVEPSRIDLLRRRVTADIRHFSSYAVAY